MAEAHPEELRENARRRVPRTKVAVPAVGPDFVRRPRLLAVLDQARDAPAIVVCAPAGSGKTLLLAGWARPETTAWVSLDGDDNDDRRFWSAILDALSGCPSVPHDSPLRDQPVPRRPSRDPGFLAAVFGALDDLPDVVRLVLDDLQELTEPEPLQGLEALVRYRPAGLRLVLASRETSSLSLARLRSAGQTTEIRAGELKFSPTEARALLAVSGVDPRPTQLRRLVEQTGGWAAGLKLAAMSLTDADKVFLGGSDREVGNYLLAEVLSELPDQQRDLLCTISVCEKVSAGLARALSGRADAATMLDTLEHETSLVARSGADGAWYRMQPLVRSYLLADLGKQAPARAAELHAKAARWFAERGRPVPALAHAVRTGDAERVSGPLRRQAVSLILSGEHEVLHEALAVVGDQVVAQDSMLALVSALLCLEEGEPEFALLHWAHADAAWPPHPGAELQLLRRLVAARQAEITGDVGDMVRATSGRLRGQGHRLDALDRLYRATALLTASDPAAAWDELRVALDAARDREQTYVATQILGILAGLAGTAGDFRQMAELAGQADRATIEHGWERTVAGATASALLAYDALLRAEPAECLRHARRAGRLTDGGQGLTLLVGTVAGAARFELGDWTAGLRQIEQARLAGGTRVSADLVALSAVVQHRAASRLGWSRVAQQALNESRLRIPDCGEILLMRARTQLSLGRGESAEKLLRPLVDGTVPAILPWTAVEASLLEAETAKLAGNEGRAVRALTRALSAAKAGGLRYPLVFGSREVVGLLATHRGQLGELNTFAAEILAARRGFAGPEIPDPLTERERSVLRLLPTLRSFDEIAQDLTVSPNTVKTHVRSIYAKLRVQRRRDAVTVAMDGGLLETPHPDLHD
ncbi:MAG TPA: LuxR C-terminal-related transcriptional regulator [Amycolatopsis sp.]|uniref:LuxR C-terminal-related transcriptional regulator n=1 Tax=Amycolatopsis sp. TaxID=37632 RepID=UPI002B47307C|nr:LuxR C-terminal-related transcriptional regulator [Amycolatopsis sp.]HKS49655.1 LuxR C-terminal-related transcriptional regulator [Amycolatopsis sp.]